MKKAKSIRTGFTESPQKTAHFDVYKIKKTSTRVALTIYPGDNEQAALTDIILEGADPEKSIIGVIENYDLGTSNSLNGKYLDVYTAITDTSTASDTTSFDFRLSGGVQPYKYFMEKTVQQQGGTIIYKISIFFITA